MFRKLSFIAIGLAIIFIIACRNLINPASPSPVISDDNTNKLYAWSPCLVVQSPGGKAFNVQMEAVKKLHNAGKMTWIRLNMNLNGDGVNYFIEAHKLGLKIIGIVHVEDLEALGWRNAFERLHAIYPSDIWQIAGEISNGGPYTNIITMTPEYYMGKFKDLNLHVRAIHPNAVLMSAPPIGSGTDGALELEKFFELGLLDMDVVVALHIYSSHSLSRYGVVLDRYAGQLAKKRIWVTETGSATVENQIAWVKEFYPQIVNVVHPEMICWYVMWAGDGQVLDNGFGLLDGVESGQITERPLFKALLGEIQ